MIIYVCLRKRHLFITSRQKLSVVCKEYVQCSLRLLGTFDNHLPLFYSNTVEMTLNTTCKHEELNLPYQMFLFYFSRWSCWPATVTAKHSNNWKNYSHQRHSLSDLSRQSQRLCVVPVWTYVCLLPMWTPPHGSGCQVPCVPGTNQGHH